VCHVSWIDAAAGENSAKVQYAGFMLRKEDYVADYCEDGGSDDEDGAQPEAFGCDGDI